MSELTSALFTGAIVLAVVFHIAWLARASRNRAKTARETDTASVRAVIADAVDISDGAAGVITWAGSWNGQRAQVRTIVDTLATRKLPTCWLSVTITEPVAVPATFDMMMRPGSATTFSNFDHLAHTLPKTTALPAEAVLRSDRRGIAFPQDLIAAHAGIFAENRAKELLIMPKGVRIVWLLAEAERARYGVFRQAAFGDARIDPALIERLLEVASTLREAINQRDRQAA